MDNQHKINDFIKLADSYKFDDIYFEDIEFMNRPYYRIHFRIKNLKGTFDVSYDEFAKASNETIIKVILKGLKYNG